MSSSIMLLCKDAKHIPKLPLFQTIVLHGVKSASFSREALLLLISRPSTLNIKTSSKLFVSRTRHIQVTASTLPPLLPSLTRLSRPSVWVSMSRWFRKWSWTNGMRWWTPTFPVVLWNCPMVTLVENLSLKFYTMSSPLTSWWVSLCRACSSS